MRLERHIFKELLVNFIFTAIVLYFVVTIAVVIQSFSKHDVPIRVSLILAPILLLKLSDLLTPLCFLVAVLFTYGRLSAENEYVATQACGVHPARTLGPMVLIGFLLCILQSWNLAFLMPNVWLRNNRIASQVAMELLANLDPSRTEFDGRKFGFYMTWKQRDGLYFEDVFIDIDGRPKDKVSANANNVESAASKANDGGAGLLLKGVAKSVEMINEGETLTFMITGFKTALPNSTLQGGNFGIVLNTGQPLGESSDFRVKPEYLTSDVLVEVAKRTENRLKNVEANHTKIEKKYLDIDRNSARRYWYEAQRRVAWSFCALMFGLIGAPVAIWMRRGTRLAAVVIALGIVFLFYYPLAKFGDAWIAVDAVPIWVCAWTATFAAVALSAVFYYRLAWK